MKRLLLLSLFFCSCSRSNECKRHQNAMNHIQKNIKYSVIQYGSKDSIRLNSFSQFYDFFYSLEQAALVSSTLMQAHILLYIDSIAIGGINPADEQSLLELHNVIERAAFRHFIKVDTSLSNVAVKNGEVKITTHNPHFYRSVESIQVILQIDCQH